MMQRDRCASAAPCHAVSLMRAPVLLLVFNRPAVARRLLDAVRAARPEQLFVAADGPRPDRPSDATLCASTRDVFTEIDWPCQVQTLYRDTNLGLTRAVISAITWFFDHVEAGVVLEDDCLPAPEFFRFAGELLEHYRDDAKVMHISGLNMAPEAAISPHSYFFTEVGHVWGWATWRRAWRLYDVTMADWPSMRSEFGPMAPPLRRALGRKFASAYAGRKITWSRVWYYTLVRHKGLAIIPSANLIENVGFGQDATHTTGDWHPLRRPVSNRMAFPLNHPPDQSTNRSYTQLLARYHYGSYARRASELAWSLVDVIRTRARRRG
jgi:hypothetical protein